jgi:hypothetical protein
VIGLIAVGLSLLGPLFEMEAQASAPPEPLARVVGAPTATCTLHGCRYEVTCEDPSGGSGCIFNLALLTKQGQLLTKAPVCILDEPGGTCPPVGEGASLGSGETTTLELDLIKTGRKVIKQSLDQGRRRIKEGGWEAHRPEFLGPESEDEAAAWDAIPGFFTYKVFGGWLVLQREEDIKIKLKG